MASFSLPPRTLWAQVVGLALVQGAIVLAWVVYNLYFGDLLQQFGFSLSFVGLILIIENVLGLIMEPLVGSFSDQVQRWLGSKFPFILCGVILSAVLFVAIPSLFLFGTATPGLRWLLPIVMVLWAIAMTLFRSPVLSLLGRYAYSSGLPQAASLLTVMGAIAGSAGPLAKEYIVSLGPGVAFGVGSVCLLLAAATLYRVRPNEQVVAASGTPSSSIRSLLKPLGLIFLTGLTITFAFQLLMFAFPKLLGTLPNQNIGLTMGMIFITIAIAAIPAGKVAQKVGNQMAMTIGLIGLTVILGLVVMTQQLWTGFGIAIALGIFLSLVNNGTLPFALELVPIERAGLGIGMFFSGRALAANLFGTLFKDSTLAPSLILLIAIGSWLVTILAIYMSQALKRSFH